ncbi:Calx-beta domain-containing protein [Microcystis aeruginosa]|uniref:Calx-beta domain-containing protein n=1 Tax=Microcystis aeruginosa TaxID=1126 RepID=UPI001E626AA0|nr:hypothetical protein [Microcystis aeruginosa]
MTPTLLPSLPAIYDVLFYFAQSDGFWANLETAFGTNYDVVKATELRNQWQSRNFSQLPPIEVLSDEVLGTAKGAYAVSTNKIYLSESFLNVASSESLVKVILEEIGHYVDAQINPVDSAGDEGEYFAKVVLNQPLTEAEITRLKTENDQAVVVIDGQSVQIEQAITLVGSYDTPGYARDVQVVGNYAYVADFFSGLQIIDISNPAAPTFKGNYNTSGLAVGVQVVGNYAYVADSSSGLLIIDISNPATPTLKGNYDTSGYANDVQVVGSYAYVADEGSGLQIIDISNPAAPTLKGNYDTSGNAWDVQIVGNYAYVADAYSGLQIIDISNPATPTLKGNYNTSYAYDVQVVGNYAYVADDYSGLQIIDISNPAAPTLKGNYDTSGYAWDVQVVGNYAYVADGLSGLQIIDISNPAAPTLKGNYDTSGYALDVQIVGNYAYVADGGDGLQILDVSEFTNPSTSTITLAVSPTSVTEDGTTNLVYTFTRSGVTTNALTVNYTLGGTATLNTDYTRTGTTNTVTFAAGSSTATVTVDPTADTTVESDETVILTLATGTGYTVGTPNAATGTITNDDISVTPIEAFGNTKLVKDATNKLYAQIGNNNPIAIKNGGTQITTNIYPGWQTLAAETVNGVNQVLWKYNDGNYLHLWSLDNNWNWQSSTGWWGLNSSEAFTQETNFQQDFNSDGVIGQPFTPIETFGNTKLVKDATNKLYAQIGNNNPIAIKNGGTQITTNIYPGWQTLAAETVNGVNQVLWKYNDGNYLHLWSLDNNWNWQSSTGWWGLNSSEAFTQETNFQQDFNGDNKIGNPLPIIGSSNDDIITGTLNNDILVGGLGNDTITGGAGSDRFTFNNRNEGIDTITDFLSSQGDKIALSAAGFGGGLAAGVAITAAQFVLGTTALNASNRLIYNTITGGLFFDGDGTGTLAAIQIATLSSKPTLTVSDILVLV